MTEKQKNNFWKKVRKTEGCWYWVGSKNFPAYGGSYGNFRLGKSIYSAHRASWFLHHGSWPTKDVLHQCDNSLCVNPVHLRLGVAKENSREASERGRLARKRRPETVPLPESLAKGRREAIEFLLDSLDELRRSVARTAGQVGDLETWLEEALRTKDEGHESAVLAQLADEAEEEA